MTRTAALMLLVSALLAAAWMSASSASERSGTSSTWCDAPVVVPIAVADSTSTRPADGVATARGASAVLSSNGPVVRMEETGSRIQVTFGQTLFHTQWLFANVDDADAVRVDALLGSQRLRLEASSARGALRTGDEQGARGLQTVSRPARSDEAEIDLFIAATELLFTNEGGSPVDLVGAVGCPALEVTAEVLVPPTWDPDLQRFVAEHEFHVRNVLANSRTAALRSNFGGAAATTVDDFAIDLDLFAAGFRDAEVSDVVVSSALAGRLNTEFDGIGSTDLLAIPLRLSTPDPLTVRFRVVYEPDFDDPSWSEGVGSPAPTVAFRGLVGDVQVGMSAVLERTGAELDSGSTSPDRLRTPAPALVVEHVHVRPPASRSDGSVTLSERIVVRNVGDAALTDLVVEYPQAAMYGRTTEVIAFDGGAANGCAGSLSTSFDGGPNAVMVSQERGLDVGEDCTIGLRTTIIPGIVPEAESTLYETAVVATASSGRRDVRDAAAVEVTLAQKPRLALDLGDPEIVNLEDGNYRLDGSLVVRNSGDQHIDDITVQLAITTARDDSIVPTRVSVEAIETSDGCTARSVPSRSTAFVGLSRDGSLPLSASCTYDYSLIARPGTVLEGWSIAGSADGASPRDRTIAAPAATVPFSLPESPSTDTTLTVADLQNNGDGSYTLVHEVVVSNTGDVPLTSVSPVDSLGETFGALVKRSTKTFDSCRWISDRSPLAAGAEPGSCRVEHTSVIEPEAALTDWTIDVVANATSTSGAVVESAATSDDITFLESPSMDTSIALVDVEKIDDRSFQFLLEGTVVNNGDIEIRSTGISVDLDAVFPDTPFVISSIRAFGARANASFDGSTDTAVLQGSDVLAAGDEASWRILVRAETADASGPFEFTSQAQAVSPATMTLEAAGSTDPRALPIVQVIDRSLAHSNNGDGTYDIDYRVTVRNVGGVTLPSIDVATDLAYVFRRIATNDISATSTCGESVAPGSACTLVEHATLRPGSAVGPYELGVSVASADADDLQALVAPAPTSIFYESRALAPLWFEEEPAITLQAESDAAVNNGDGTYTVDHRFVLTNNGDVPLYRVRNGDPIEATFGRLLSANEVVIDTCAEVSFDTPLIPGQNCVRTQTTTIRPWAEMGPWEIVHSVTADSPTFATVSESVALEPLTFEEAVSIDATSTIEAHSNVGDGTYLVAHRTEIENSGDVPLVDIATSDPGISLGARIIDSDLEFDSCSSISSSRVLLPGETCTVETVFTTRPGSALGPLVLSSEVSGTSPSGRERSVRSDSNPLTLTESPRLALGSEVVSVEVVDEDRFRVVTNLEVHNVGDVRVDELQFDLDLDELFATGTYRIDGLISNDFEIDEDFAAGESADMLERGQSLRADEAGVVTLIVSIEPGGSAGPFVGDFHAEAVSPAANTVRTTIEAKVDLPSIAVDVVAQSADNNRDGSYTVTTTYEVINDGTTPLEFVQLNEDLDSIYLGTDVARLTIDSPDFAVAELDDPRSEEVLQWGETMRVGQRVLVTTTVLVTPGNVLGPFTTQVELTAASPTGTVIESFVLAATPIEFVEQPALRVDQRLLSRPVWRSKGSFDVTFAIDVINDGDVELRNVQITQDLLNALGPNAAVAVRELRSGTLAVNGDFDGLGRVSAASTVDAPTDDGSTEAAEPAEQQRDAGDTRLLEGWNVLPAGVTATIELDLTLTPETRGVYSTRVVASAITPAGAGVGSAGQEIEANTLTRLSVQGELGVAKRVLGDPAVRPDGSVAVTYEILVENAGPFPLTNVEVHDQLSQAFGTGSTFVTSRVRTEGDSPCMGFARTSYDGGAIDPVLVAGVQLAPGEGCRIQYDAVVLPSKALPGPFRSSAFALASDPFSGTVIDDSTDGTNTDPDGNQEPGDNDVATSVRVEVPTPSLDLAVDTVDVVQSARQGWFDFSYLITVTNTGPIDVDSTEILARLDEAWSVPFGVIGVESSDLVVNPGFDGDDQLNVVSRRNRIRAGEAVTVTVRVSAARPSSGELPVDFEVVAASVTGVVIEQATTSPVVATVPASTDGSGQMFASLTVEEKRLLTLGGLAFLLFFGIFVRRVMRRFRAFRERRVRRLAGELVIDLRSGRTIDVRERPHEPARASSDARRHHESRRRRGRDHRIDR